MTRMLALGEVPAAALARSRTMEAFVLKRSMIWSIVPLGHYKVGCSPSRVMPGLRGTPAGIKTISAPLKASSRPVLSGT